MRTVPHQERILPRRGPFDTQRGLEEEPLEEQVAWANENRLTWLWNCYYLQYNLGDSVRASRVHLEAWVVFVDLVRRGRAHPVHGADEEDASNHGPR